MSHFSTIIDFIQTLSLKDEESNKLSKEIDEVNRENMEHENQLEDLEREYLHLQIEHHNSETISSFNDVSGIENLSHISQKMYKDCVELKSLIDKIDFTKILQCNHMEMEAKCRKEWQPVEDCFVKTLNWHQQMEQRHIVQRYRRAEAEAREVEDASKNQMKSMEESLKQSIGLINQAKDKRNNILITLIKDRENCEDLHKKMMKLNQYQVYIEDLRQEKLKIQNQLQETHLKAFNPLNSSGTHNFAALTIKPNQEACNFIMPKFPTFSEILKSFNQAKNVTNIAAVQNSTSCCIKSILNSTSSKTRITKQTKNVHFKLQLEEYQAEITEIETDVEEMSSKTTMEVNELQDDEMKDLENNTDIETIDLLTPADNTKNVVKETMETNDHFDYDANTKKIANKTKVDIQDCVIFKTPFPIEELNHGGEQDNNVNMPNNVNFDNSKLYTDMCSSASNREGIKETLSSTNNSFYEEFLRSSSSSEASPKKLTDYEAFLDENKESVFFSKDSNEDQKQMNASTNNYSSEIQDFLDFGTNRHFDFDSDDNIGDSYNPKNMNFM